MDTLPHHIVFMKAGEYCGEPLEHIIVRKKKEVEDCGMFYWGYGGTICHPTTQVQPFVQEMAEAGNHVYFVMTEIRSKPKKRKNSDEDEESPDKNPRAMKWSVARGKKKKLVDPVDVDPAINVYGSEFALVCGKPTPCDFDLDMRQCRQYRQSRIDVPPTEGKLLSECVTGSADKACAIWSPSNDPPMGESPRYIKRITMIAPLIEPYAVFLEY